MAVLPIPPTTTPYLDPATGAVSEPWQRFFISLEESTGTFAPIDADYWVSRSNGALSNEVNLGTLASGYLKITVALGIATPSTTTTVPAADISGLTGASGLLDEGNYTPTPNITTNITSVGMSPCQWVRVLDTVTVSGQIQVSPIGAGACQFEIDLPVSSDFSQVSDCGGAGAFMTGTIPVAIQANVADDSAEFDFTVPDGTTRTFTFSFTYRVI